MLLGPYYIYECPCCKTKYKKMTLKSSNNLGATSWTDGKENAPMCPDIPQIGKCQNCLSILWLEEFPIIEKIDYKEKEKHNEIKKIIPLNKEDVLFLINNLNAEKLKKEEYLRIKYWHLCNDERREDYFLIDENNQDLIKNLKTLSEIIDKSINHNLRNVITDISTDLSIVIKNIELFNHDEQIEKEKYLVNKYGKICKEKYEIDLYSIDKSQGWFFQKKSDLEIIYFKLNSFVINFKENYDTSRIMLAEIYRELGNFEMAIETIDSYEFYYKYYTDLAFKIKELAKNKDKEVKVL